MPWLARSGTWTNSSTYTIVLRNGITWSDGSAFTSADVAYTIELAKTNPAVPYSNLGPFLAGVSTPNATTVVVHFQPGCVPGVAELPLAQPDRRQGGLVDAVCCKTR